MYARRVDSSALVFSLSSHRRGANQKNKKRKKNKEKLFFFPNILTLAMQANIVMKRCRAPHVQQQRFFMSKIYDIFVQVSILVPFFSSPPTHAVFCSRTASHPPLLEAANTTGVNTTGVICYITGYVQIAYNFAQPVLYSCSSTEHRKSYLIAAEPTTFAAKLKQDISNTCS